METYALSSFLVHLFKLGSPNGVPYTAATFKKNRHLRVWVGNIRFIPVQTCPYDAILNFGAIYHVINWRAMIEEVYRVLKIGDRLYYEEILSRYITHPNIGKLMDHPQQDRFDQTGVVHALSQTGFKINAIRQWLDLYLWVIATKPKPRFNAGDQASFSSASGAMGV